MAKFNEAVDKFKKKLADNPRALVKSIGGEFYNAGTGLRVFKMGDDKSPWWFVADPNSDGAFVSLNNAIADGGDSGAIWNALSASDQDINIYRTGGHAAITPEGGDWFNLESRDGQYWDADWEPSPVTTPGDWAAPEGAPDWLKSPEALGELSLEDFNAYMERYGKMVEHGLMPDYYKQMNQPEEEPFNLESASADQIMKQMALLQARDQYQQKYGEQDEQPFDISTASTADIQAQLERAKAVQSYEEFMRGEDENQDASPTQGPITTPGGAAPGQEAAYTSDFDVNQGGYTEPGQNNWMHDANFDPGFGPPSADNPEWMQNQNNRGRY